MKHKRSRSISSRVAEEAINEIMMAGLAFLLVISGVNYFNMKWAWAKILAGAATGTEVGNMLSSLAQTFPFEYLFVQLDFWGTLTIAIILTVVGISLKAFTVHTKGKFLIDIGKNIYTPAIIGFFVIVGLQLWTAFNVDDYLSLNSIARPEFASGYFIWNTYGQVFLLGASLLVIGAVVKLVGEKNRSDKTIIVGDTMFHGAFIAIIYYIIIRAIALPPILNSEFGKIMKLFIISTQYANFTIIVCIFMFTFGLAMKDYGIKVLKHERRLHHMHELHNRKEEMRTRYGGRPVQNKNKDYPHNLHVDNRQHLRHPAYDDPNHPVHRYMTPEGRYKKPK